MKLNKTTTTLCYFLALLGTAQEAVAAPISANDSWSYTVKKNDVLELVCAKYCLKKTNIHEIAAFNQLRNIHLLQPNQTIKIPLGVLKTINVSANILDATGDVQIKKSELGAFQKINIAEQLLAGAIVKTGLNSIVKLRFADGSETVLQPNSTLKVLASHQYAGKLNYVIKLQLSAGRTEITANPAHLENHHLEVETPSAVAVVRGTQFRVAADPANAVEETLRGHVAFAVGEHAVDVHENFGSVSVNGQVPLPPQQLPNPPETNSFSNSFDELPISFPINSAVAGTVWAQLAKNAAFTEIIDEKTQDYSSQLATHVLRYDNLTTGQYFLKLRTQDVTGLQSIDAIHSFTMNPIAVRPILTFPKEVTLVDGNTDFKWTHLSNKNAFLIQIASDAAFNHIVLEKLTSFNTFNLVSDLPKGEYYWRVAEKQGVERSQYKFSKPAQFNF